MAFKDVLEQRLNICFDDDGNFNKLEIQGNYTIVKKSEITAVDASSAANTAFHDIELFAMFYQYFGNYNKNLISNKALAIDENFNERKLVVNRGKYKTIESDNSTGIGDLSESIITQLINNAYYTMPQLMRIIKLHNRAISNNGLENGFLNLWSILEITCVKDLTSQRLTK